MSAGEARPTAAQARILGTLTLGYAGYYVCRSNLSVTSNLIVGDPTSGVADKAAFGTIASTAIFAYAIGKLTTGFAADFLGGKRLFVLAMFGSIAATVAFGLAGGLGAFIVIWSANRFVQSAGWGAAVRIASQWFPRSLYGRAMAVLAQSYLFGDVVARLFLGELVGRGASWRQVYFVAAVVLAAAAVLAIVVLRERPEDAGEPPLAKEDIAQGVFDEDEKAGDLPGGEAPSGHFWVHVAPFLRSGAFWLVCAMSFGLTLVRETLNLWSPDYLRTVCGMTPSVAAKWSAVFPFFGGLSVLVTGALTDRLGGRRGGVMVAFLIPVGIGLVGMGYARTPWLALTMLSLTGFSIMGPYAFLSGALSLDLGSRRGSATAAGLIDGVGYLAAVLSGRAVGQLVQKHGWGVALFVLAGIAAFAACAAIAYRVFIESNKVAGKKVSPR